MHYLIIGGGISGVTVLEELIRLFRDDEHEEITREITLLHAGPSLTRIAAFVQVTERLEEVTEIASIDHTEFLQDAQRKLPEHIRLRLVEGQMVGLDAERKIVSYLPSASNQSSGSPLQVSYDKVCFCTGARPKLFLPESSTLPKQLLSIRDASSIAHLASELAQPVPPARDGTIRRKCVAVVGNGGIALELVYALQTSQLTAINAADAVATTTEQNVAASASSSFEPSASPLSLPPLSISWIVKNSFLGSTFLDHMSSAFLLPTLFPEGDPEHSGKTTARENDAAMSDSNDAPAAASVGIPPHVEEEKIVAVEHGKHVQTRFVGLPGASASSLVSASTAAERATPNTGPALGPQWLNQLQLDTNIPKYVLERERMKHQHQQQSQQETKMEISDSSVGVNSSSAVASAVGSVSLSLSLGCEVSELIFHPPTAESDPSAYSLTLVLTNGERVDCDLVVSATGVRPNTDWATSCPSLKLSSEGGIIIDENMCTSIADVYACGDCSSLVFSPSFLTQHDPLAPNLFHQQRLWSHAKMLGLYAARAMSGLYDSELMELGGFNFLLYAHTTVIFGRKVVLLGRYNLQGWSVDQISSWKHDGLLRTLVRCNPHSGTEEFIKLHLLNDRLVGGILIGGDETMDLEETFENLMLNQSNLKEFGDFLNDVQVDLADYFD